MEKAQIYVLDIDDGTGTGGTIQLLAVIPSVKVKRHANAHHGEKFKWEVFNYSSDAIVIEVKDFKYNGTPVSPLLPATGGGRHVTDSVDPGDRDTIPAEVDYSFIDPSGGAGGATVTLEYTVAPVDNPARRHPVVVVLLGRGARAVDPELVLEL